MKKITKMKLVAVFVGIMLMLMPFAVIADEMDEVTVTIDGEIVTFPDQGPIIVDGRTLVPVRGVFEALGWEANWDSDTSTALISRGHISISITIGELQFGVLVYDLDSPHPGHGAIHILDVPAQLIGGRTMLPLRAVLESVGYSLEWDGETRTVLISTPQLGRIIAIEEYDGATATTLELIYVDEFENRYYLSSMRSGVIMLTFEDGIRISLREAIDQQKVTIDELIANGLNLIIESPLQGNMERDSPQPSLTGRFISSNNGYILILADGSPVIMSNQSGVDNLFVNLQTGYKIRVSYPGIVLDSFPQQTSIYDYTLIKEGSIDDIPQEILEILFEMGWITE